MQNKYDLLARVFERYPLWLVVLRDKAAGMTEEEIGAKHKFEKCGTSEVKKIRKDLNRLFGTKSWDELIFQAKDLGFVKEVKEKFVMNYEPTDYLKEMVEEIEGKILDVELRKAKKKWKKKKRQLRWREE